MGPRKVLTRIVIWWSAFTAATGLAWNFASLVVARLLFGIGEAGAFPNTSRSFAKWFPVSERGAVREHELDSVAGLERPGFSREGRVLAPAAVVRYVAGETW